MLDTVDLSLSMSKQEYKQVVAPLKQRLTLLQQEIRQKGLPIVILFEGWGTAGKGTALSDMILTLDPRGFRVHSTQPATEEERRRPFLWRFWTKTPAKGEMAIFDRSWYQEISIARLEEDIEDKEAQRRMESICTFERQLTDGGCLILKFFLHISEKEQHKRLEELERDKDTAWRVTPADKRRNRMYRSYYDVFEEMLQKTNTPWAPWHVIPGTDRRAALACIYRILVDSIEDALQNGVKLTAVPTKPFPSKRTPRLADVRLDQSVGNDEYKEKLEHLQKKLERLHNRVYLSRIPVIVAYEGWDAAGKGGNIRRLAAALDPRGYEVVPVSAPSKEELAHHYLWRFWNRLPKSGHIAVFDRTWYGRVLVERVEELCSPEQWRRAYREINEFEKELADWGAVIVKFWLQIDRDEQLRRFEARQNTPEKRWKITEEDWRNREKWPQYETAVDEMLQKTSTKSAPWNIIPSQDKKYARLQALTALVEALEARV